MADKDSNEIDHLLLEREREHGGAWLTTGEVLEFIRARRQSGILKLIVTGLFYTWVEILGKLIRILQTPGNLEHWRDIEGYARLVRKHIEGEEEPLPF